MRDMITISFTVNRKREEDGGPQVLKCEIRRERAFGEAIDYHYDSYNEKIYDRFCNQVPEIVSSIHGEECGYDWYFEHGPFVVTE